MNKDHRKIFLLSFVILGLIFSQTVLAKIVVNQQNPAKAKTIQEVINNILNFMTVIAIPLAVTFLIISGLKFFMAQGNEAKISSAKKTFLWTIVGIIILVGMKVISATITKFFETKGWSLVKKACAASNVPVWHVQNLTPYNTPTDFINAIASFLLTIAMPLVTVAIIWAGIQFFFAQGNEAKISRAKNTLKWAVLGLAVVIGAYAIVATIKQAF